MFGAAKKRLLRPQYAAFLFFRPDYTVGIGISPIRGRGPSALPFADFTAGEEFRLAPKNIFYLSMIILRFPRFVNKSEKVFFYK